MSIIADRIKQVSFENEGQEAIISLLAVAAHLREKLNLICEEENISLQQFNILRILKGAYPEGYPRCDISERMVERAPDTTRLIDRMAKTSLVSREKCTEDKRQSISKITKVGIDLLNRTSVKVKRFHKQFEENLTAAKCRQISDNCNTILKY